MQDNLSWKPGSRAGGEEICCLLWISKYLYHVYKSPSTDPAQNQVISMLTSHMSLDATSKHVACVHGGDFCEHRKLQHAEIP
jgi:hypothetical protein